MWWTVPCNYFSVKEPALPWMKSYLSDRTQTAFVSGRTSPNVYLHFGVSQRSVWGPKNYYMYTKPVGKIITVMLVAFRCIYDIKVRTQSPWHFIISWSQGCRYEELAEWQHGKIYLKLNSISRVSGQTIRELSSFVSRQNRLRSTCIKASLYVRILSVISYGTLGIVNVVLSDKEHRSYP